MNSVSPVIEIIEYVPGDAIDDGPHTIIVPNDVRINGVSLLCSDDPIIVHQISTQPTDVVKVTLTLIARRVTIEQRTRDQVDVMAEGH